MTAVNGGLKKNNFNFDVVLVCSYIDKIYDPYVLDPGAPQTICALTVRGIASQTQTVREAAITSVGQPA